MDIMQAIQERHSVRSYSDKPIDPDAKKEILSKIEEINQKSGLHIQLVCDEPQAFDGFMAHYGKFSGVKNYIAMIGKKADDLPEKIGYYGEQLVLLAQQLGLNTCWVAMTYKKVKSAYKLGPGEKLSVVIALGYGNTQGVPHESKDISKVSQTEGNMPDWFKKGIHAALLAPTAMNQQKFTLIQKGNTVKATAGSGFYVKIDLGIVKYHFEVGAGTENFKWV